MRTLAYKFFPFKRQEKINESQIKNEIPLSLKLPTSKSYSNRALVISALANGTVHLKNVQSCDDIDCMIQGLKNLGITIQEMGRDLIVHGQGGEFTPAEESFEIDGLMAGTTTRFLMALTSIVSETVTIVGRGRLPERPFKPLLDFLKRMGKSVDILSSDPNHSLPVRISGARVSGGGKVKLQGNETGQFITGILMVAPLMKNGLILEVEGEITSRPYINMTLEIMKDFGVNVREEGKVFIVEGNQKYRRPTGVYVVEGDWTHAGYFLVMGLMKEKGAAPLVLHGANMDSVQGDKSFYNILQDMGGSIETKGLDILVYGMGANGISKELTSPNDVDLTSMPDLAPTLILLLCFVPGTHKIKGINNLKFKESDRLYALTSELKKLNFFLRHYPEKNELVFDGKDLNEVKKDLSQKLGPIILNTYSDHRMAMVFSLLGLVLDNILVKDPFVVQKSYPKYWEDYRRAGGKFIEVEI